MAGRDQPPGPAGRPEEPAGAYAGLLGRDAAADAGHGGPDSAGPAAAPPPVVRLVEALLFLGGPPLTADRAAEAVRGLTPGDFLQAIGALNRDYRAQGRPYRIRPRERGYELALLPRFRAVRERLYGGAREAHLTPVTLDVLALVAYRQPVSRSEVDSLRGADSAAALRQLVRLGLVAVQRGGDGAREVTYATTSRFLSLFGLRNLEDLPRTDDLQRL
jgi:segregation and condensation protein B